MRRPGALLLALFAVGGACIGCASGRVTPAVAPAPPEAAARVVLDPAGVRPLRQRLELSIEPAAAGYSGLTEIDLQLDRPQRALLLHVNGLEIDGATLEGVSLDASGIELSPEAESLTLVPPRPLPAGVVTVAVRFRGRYGDAIGLVRDGRTVVSALAGTGARRAFPCIDDPAAKIPWRVTLVVPPGETALANAAATSTTESGGSKRVVFAETRPLPPHLVAVAVGPFEMVTAGMAGRVSLRFAVPRGRSDEIHLGIEAVPRLVAALEELTGTPYPYPKLDVVLVARAGGGEPAGLLALSDEALVPPEEVTLARRQLVGGIVAHVLARQWLGNLVSRHDDGDPWLEPAASWLALRALDQVEPSWRVGPDRVAAAAGAPGAGATRAAAIVQLAAAYGGTAGAALHAFLAAHADGAVPFARFLEALSPDVAAAAPRLLAAPSPPFVAVRLGCPAGGPPRIVLETEGDLSVPVCVSWPRGRGRGRACAVVTGSAEVPLAETRACPAWVIGNDGGEGVHRVAYTPGLLSRLAGAAPSLTVAERLALLLDARALVRAGRLELADALPLVPALAGDAAPEVVEATAELLGEVRRWSLPPGADPAFTKLAARLYDRRARQLGWRPRLGESVDATRTRPIVLRAAVELAGDRDLARGAEGTVVAALRGAGKDQDPELVAAALLVAGRGGSQELFDRLRTAVRDPSTPDRGRLVAALGRFDDLEQANATLALVPELDPADAIRALAPLLDAPGTRDLTWDYLASHARELLGRDRESALALLGLPRGLCQTPPRVAVDLLARAAADVDDGASRLAAAVSRSRACATAARKDALGVARWLKSQR